MKKSFLRTAVISLIVIGIVSMGMALHARNVSPRLHPNLAEAQTLIEKAIDKLTVAQEANGFDMEGHAAKAKVLLEQAYSEIKLAALAANAHRK